MGRAIPHSRTKKAWLLATLFSVVAALVPATAGADDSTRHLPSQNDVDALRGLLESAANDLVNSLTSGQRRASSCTVTDGRLSCVCVEGADIRADEWAADSLRNFAWVTEHRAFFVGEVIEADGVWLAQDFRFATPDGDMVVRAAEARLIDGRVDLSDVDFRRRTERSGPGECGTEILAGGSIVARAAEARFEGAGWQLSGLRAPPWPVPFASDAHQTAPGLLPPTVRVADGDVEVQADALVFGPLTVSVLGRTDGQYGAPIADARFGAGLGLVTRRRDRVKKVDALATFGPQLAVEDPPQPVRGGGFEPLLLGELSIGERAHVRGDFEQPGIDTGWHLRALEHGAFFRNLRASRLGVSMSGAAHSLQVAGTVHSVEDEFEDRWSGDIAYGTVIDGGRFAVWNVDMTHRTIDIGDETTHSALTTIAWSALFGDRAAAWASPSVALAGNFSAVTASRGFDASTTLSVLPSVDAGLAFEGRWARVEHRISPRVRFGGEALGLQQRQPEEGAPPFPYAQPDRWRYLVASLDQTVRDGSFVIDAPLGVFADALGDESLGDAFGEAALFTRPAIRSDAGALYSGVACELRCVDPRLLLGGHLRPTESLLGWYSLSNTTARQTALLHIDELLESTHHALRLLNDPNGDEPYGHQLGARWTPGSATVGVGGRWGTTAASRGLSADLGWQWEALGWGLGASGAWAPQTGDWAAYAGLRLAP